MRSTGKNSLLALVFLLLFTGSLLAVLKERSEVSVLKENTCEQADFRRQHLETEIYEQIRKETQKGGDFCEILTATMLQGNFYPEKMYTDSSVYRKYKPKAFFSLMRCYGAIWKDVRCFPIPAGNISYEDTFGEPRGADGERLHEGTDLFGRVDRSGYYPVLSMTDGVVEKVGWLALGGYRIGIRAPAGAYFYYAHLSEYEKEFVAGDKVKAGDILGYMGNTGYGEEGTAGKFPVHLHLGIYIQTPDKQELSVDPFWVLKSSQKNIRKYTY